MKEGIHPTLNPVIFVDGEHEFITLSTKSSNTAKTPSPNWLQR